MLHNVKRTYALSEFTVEHRAKGWHFWKTYGDKTDIKGPYSSPASGTLMIAGQLQCKIAKRGPVHQLP